MINILMVIFGLFVISFSTILYLRMMKYDEK